MEIVRQVNRNDVNTLGAGPLYRTAMFTDELWAAVNDPVMAKDFPIYCRTCIKKEGVTGTYWIAKFNEGYAVHKWLKDNNLLKMNTEPDGMCFFRCIYDSLPIEVQSPWTSVETFIVDIAAACVKVRLFFCNSSGGKRRV